MKLEWLVALALVLWVLFRLRQTACPESFQSGKKRVAILIICAEEGRNKRWDLEIETWKRYMNSLPGIDAYFLRCKEPELNAPRNNYLVFDCVESFVPGIFQKTILSLEQLVGKYDYYVRTNLSTFIVYDHLLELLRQLDVEYKPGEPLYTGGLAFDWGISGTSIVLNDVAARNLVALGKDRMDSTEPDDVLIGHLMKDPAPVTNPLYYWDFESPVNHNLSKIEKSGLAFVRLRNDNERRFEHLKECHRALLARFNN